LLPDGFFGEDEISKTLADLSEADERCNVGGRNMTEDLSQDLFR
jgi:hypothetical protein